MTLLVIIRSNGSSDLKKTIFQTAMGKFHYTVILSSLKNPAATYQSAMTPIFHFMFQECLEDYVDDAVIKSSDACHHISDLRKVNI